MAVTFELLEEFTGTREYSAPDGETHEMVVYTENTTNVLVRFTDGASGRSWNMHLDVLFDEEGNYDADATVAHFQAIADGEPV
jgi:hypothetical protein